MATTDHVHSRSALHRQRRTPGLAECEGCKRVDSEYKHEHNKRYRRRRQRLLLRKLEAARHTS